MLFTMEAQHKHERAASPSILRKEVEELTKNVRLATEGPFRWVFPRHKAEQVHIRQENGEESWQFRTLKFLHSRKVQYTLMALLLLDVMILFIELFLQATFPHCLIIERDAISCCPVSGGTRFLASDEDICEPPYHVTDYQAGCDGHKWHVVHTIEIVLFSFTLAILTTFLLENLAMMVVITPTVYFRHFGYVLDLSIVSLSISLEVTLKAMDHDNLSTLAGLLILARCWRFVRISHGLVEVTAEFGDHKHQKLLAYTEELEDALRRHNLPVPNTESIRLLHGSNGDELTDAVEKEERNHFKHHFHSEMEALEALSLDEEKENNEFKAEQQLVPAR